MVESESVDRVARELLSVSRSSRKCRPHTPDHPDQLRRPLALSNTRLETLALGRRIDAAESDDTAVASRRQTLQALAEVLPYLPSETNREGVTLSDTQSSAKTDRPGQAPQMPPLP